MVFRFCLRVENPVYCSKKVPDHLVPLLGASLYDINKVIQVDIDVGCHIGALRGREMLLASFILGL